ncbi:20S proteasome, regulatory subunit beta, putative [Ixodes scapularis]|uniref:Proteasome subunit beta n=1 Tax=Ixodes scapularis TaxID=6945 RepID=B7PU47_IXOSC|nr:20S proteasome, regulatory subunit beta, putative [Ixodes scapularis]|eukprot:XP_002405427.1 20S proteasome, regulatory subunit beta, putative [Ixodes scapularis]
MECLMGVVFKDFALLAADKTSGYSIIVLKHDEDKIHKLSDNLLMAVCGEAGDTVQFAEFIAKNIQLYKMRNGRSLLPPFLFSSILEFIVENWSFAATPYSVNLLLAGFDKQAAQPELFYMDYLATMAKVPYGAHGYGAFFLISVLDRYYREDMNEEEAVDLLKKCVFEVQKRFLVNLPAFKVQVVDKNGIRTLKDISVLPEGQ